MPKPRLSRGVVAGVIGGLVGSLWLKAFIVGGRSLRAGAWVTPLDQGGPAHQVAHLVVKALTGRGLTPAGRVVGGEVVHYAFGAVVGGFYGGLAEYAPWTTAGIGTVFGTGVFLAADETSMPALGLVNKPWEETLAAQTEHYLAHLLFGISAELTRRAVRVRLTPIQE